MDKVADTVADTVEDSVTATVSATVTDLVADIVRDTVPDTIPDTVPDTVMDTIVVTIITRSRINSLFFYNFNHMLGREQLFSSLFVRLTVLNTNGCKTYFEKRSEKDLSITKVCFLTVQFSKGVLLLAITNYE